MNKRNMVRLVVLAASLMACLAGCGGQKYIGIQTLLTLEQDNTGNRQIRMSIGKSDFETFFDGKIDELNKQLEAV